MASSVSSPRGGSKLAFLLLSLLSLSPTTVAQFPPPREGITLLRSKFHENVTISFKEVSYYLFTYLGYTPGVAAFDCYLYSYMSLACLSRYNRRPDKTDGLFVRVAANMRDHARRKVVLGLCPPPARHARQRRGRRNARLPHQHVRSSCYTS